MTLPRDAMPLPIPVALTARGQGTSTESEQEVAEETEKTQNDAPTEWQEDTPQFQPVNGYYPQDMYSPDYVVYETAYPFMPPTDMYYGTPTCVLVPYSAMADFTTMHGLGVPCLPQEYAYPYYQMLPPAMAAT
jgi:hypothetical protein